jgi:HK97 family phage major capsid protein
MLIDRYTSQSFRITRLRLSQMADLQKLRDEQETTKSEIAKLRDTIATRRTEGKSGVALLAPEERSAFDKLKDEYKTRKELIESEERADSVSKFLEEESAAEERSRRGAGGRFDPLDSDKLPGEDGTYGDRFGKDRSLARQHAQSEERKALVVSAWARAGKFHLTDEERSACSELKVDPSVESLKFDGFNGELLKRLRGACGTTEGEQRSARAERFMSRLEERAVGGNTVRGNIVPQVMVRQFELAIVTYGGIYNAADVMVSDNASAEAWPTGNDTANEGRQVSEPAELPLAGVDPTFGKFMLGGYEFTSDFVRVGNVTLRDTSFDLASIIGGMLGERLVKIINRRATVGTGSSTLRGITLNANYGVDMADNEVYTWKELLKLKHSVDSRHRETGSFMMHDDILLQYMLETDDHNRPILIEPNGEAPGRLLNRPYVINNHMPDPTAVAAGTATAGIVAVMFGNLKAYKLKLIGQVRTSKLIERFAEDDQTGFLAFRGADGGLLNPGDNPVKALGVKKT